MYLLIQNEELASLFNAGQIKAVLPAVPRICSWFNHALQWMELVFTLLSTPVVEALVLEVLSWQLQNMFYYMHILQYIP